MSFLASCMMRIDSVLISWLSTLWALGQRNLLRVARYRTGLFMGLSRVRRLKGEAPYGPFFSNVEQLCCLPATTNWINSCRYFGWLERSITTDPPDWFFHPVSGKRISSVEKPWWNIPDYDTEIGDIKGIWELSRFDWVLAFAQQAAAGNSNGMKRLNSWIEHW